MTDGRFLENVFVCVCFYAFNACNDRSVLDLMFNEGHFEFHSQDLGFGRVEILNPDRVLN